MKNSIMLIVILALLSCSKSTEPTIRLEYQLEIIPDSDISISWDTTYYQHDTTWVERTFPDTIAADSFATVLCNSNLPITDLWYPQVGRSGCKILFREGSYVIVKLGMPDLSTKLIGLRTRSTFPISCINTWRHYKFTQK